YKMARKGLNPWYSDMWSLLWNLWLSDKTVKIHAELEFLWPDDDISQWRHKAILHYTGFKEGGVGIFDKTKYLSNTPWFDKKLSTISQSSCSSIVVEEIVKRRKEIEKQLPVLNGLFMLLLCDEVNDGIISMF